MDYFNDVLATFLDLERGSCVAVNAGSESSRISSKKKIFICVPKMNEDLTGLEQDEWFMIEFFFLGELTL